MVLQSGVRENDVRRDLIAVESTKLVGLNIEESHCGH